MRSCEGTFFFSAKQISGSQVAVPFRFSGRTNTWPSGHGPCRMQINAVTLIIRKFGGYEKLCYLVVYEVTLFSFRMVNQKAIMSVVVAFTIALNLTGWNWPNGHMSSTYWRCVVLFKTSFGFSVVQSVGFLACSEKICESCCYSTCPDVATVMAHSAISCNHGSDNALTN